MKWVDQEFEQSRDEFNRYRDITPAVGGDRLMETLLSGLGLQSVLRNLCGIPMTLGWYCAFTPIKPVTISKEQSVFVTLRDAYAAASTADRADQLAGRCEELMEVGPLRYPVGSGPTDKVVKPDPVSQALDSVIRRLAKVEKLMTWSAEAVPRRAPPGRRQWASPGGRQPPPHFFGKRAWNEDGTPNCFNCGRRGHIAIYCPQVGGNGPPKNASAPLPVNASGSG